MYKELIPEMLTTCTDSRSCNRFLNAHGIHNVRFQCQRKTFHEMRRIYTLRICAADHEYRIIHQSTDLQDCIVALGYY